MNPAMSRRGILRVLPALASLLLGLCITPLSRPAAAFDIPTPQNAPQSKIGFFSAPKAFPPLVPLAPIDSATTNDSGAGHLPDGVSVQTTVHLPAQGALEHAPLLVTMTWFDRNKSVANFRLHRPNGEHFGSRRIRVGQEIRVIDGKQVIAHTYQWALTPLAGGVLTLDFARMTFQQVGQPDLTYEYQPVSRLITVRPIPGFWPQTLPVSTALRVKADPLPPLVAGQPATWRFTLTGQDLTEYTVRQLLEPQLIGGAALGIGQPEIRLSPTAPVPADDDLAQTFDVRIPLLPDPQGHGAAHGTLPELRLPYLDRDAATPGQTLSYTVVPPQTLHWAPTASARFWDALAYWWWRGALIAAAGIALGVALFDLGQRLAARRRHRQAQQRLAACTTPDALWQQLRQITGCQHTAELIARAPNPWFSDALHALDRARFAPTPANEIEPTRDELVRWLPTQFFQSRRHKPNGARAKRR